MVNKWQEFTLSEIVDLVIDNRGRNPSSYSDTGIPVIDNYLITSEGEPKLSEVKRYISPDIYESFIRKYNQPKDVLLTLVGNGYGKVAISPEEQCIIIQNTIGLRTKEGFDNLFLYYLLRGNRVSLTNLNRGAAQPSIKVGDILSLKFNFPSFKHQKAIGNTLYILDQKIKHNTQTNQTLEQMAQALFKSWFVDFDPVFDNALASGMAVNDFPEALQKKAEQRQQLQQKIANGEPSADKKAEAKLLPEDILQLFPSEFEQTDEPSVGINGWLPKGWKTPYVYDLGDFINGAAYKKFEPNKNGEGLPIIKIVELKSGITGNTGFSTVNMPEKYRLSDKDILFSWSGNPETSIDTFVWSLGDAWLNQHIFKVIPNDQCSYPFLLSLLKYLKPEFSSIARDKQTTGLGHVTVKDLKNLAVVLPQIELLEVFDKQVSPLYERAFLNMKNTSELENARDFLLPKLISGQLQLQE